MSRKPTDDKAAAERRQRLRKEVAKIDWTKVKKVPVEGPYERSFPDVSDAKKVPPPGPFKRSF
jgi:hypothetical protein